MNHDYGKCHVCGATIEERNVDHSVQDGQDWLLIRAVPTGVCTRCGERVLRWQVAERLEEIPRRRRQVAPTEAITVPVFTFAAPVG